MAQKSIVILDTGKASLTQLNEATQEPVFANVESGQASVSLWSNATPATITIGGGAANTGIQLGSASTTVTIPGNLTVNGTTTTVNTTNMTVSDDVILLAAGAVSGDEAGVAFERGATGNDAIFLWNEANTRFELGLFDTVAGTVAPTGALGTLSDLRIDDLSLAGTTVTADGALTVSSSGSGNDLTLSAAGGGAQSLVLNSAGTAVDAIRINTTNAAGGMDIDAGTGGISMDTTAGFSISGVTASFIGASGAAADLTFQGRATTITLNESGGTSLAAGFTGNATSIVGALNYLLGLTGGGSNSQLIANYVNGDTNMVEGEVVSPSTTTAGQVVRADASTEGAPSLIIGFASAAVANAASGDFVTEGSGVQALLVTGLTLALGDELFLSTTAGRLTNVAPSGSGNVVQSIATVTDVQTYTGAGEALVEIQIIRGSKIVVA